MNQAVRNRILHWFQEGLKSVDPAEVTRRALREFEPGSGRLIVLAIGKAAVPMAEIADEVFGESIHAGLVVTKNLTAEIEGWKSIEASHPIPNQKSLDAGEAALDLVSNLTSEDTVLVLLSGGGSALMEYPIEGISLMDMQVTTELLMHAGAGIHELNTVRKALSAIKGGGLRRAIGDARCITFMLSDVAGNDHSVIASGPTVPEPTHRNQAWEVIEDLRVQHQIPDAVRLALSEDAPPAPVIDTSRDHRQVIADNRTLVEAIHSAAERNGMRVNVAIPLWRDSAHELAQKLVAESRNAGGDIDVLIGGGEATSIVKGKGSGGRNTETALVAALNLTAKDEWTIASLASDGDDGNSGSAGAIVDSSTVEDADGAKTALETSDSAGYLQQRDALVVTGPTGTNVMDVYVAVRNSAISGDSRE